MTLSNNNADTSPGRLRHAPIVPFQLLKPGTGSFLVSPQRRNESVPALRRSRYLMESRASPPGWTGDTPVPPPYESWVKPNISNQTQIQELVEKNTSLAFHRAKAMKDPQGLRIAAVVLFLEF